MPTQRELSINTQPEGRVDPFLDRGSRAVGELQIH